MLNKVGLYVLILGVYAVFDVSLSLSRHLVWLCLLACSKWVTWFCSCYISASIDSSARYTFTSFIMVVVDPDREHLLKFSSETFLQLNPSLSICDLMWEKNKIDPQESKISQTISSCLICGFWLWFSYSDRYKFYFFSFSFYVWFAKVEPILPVK